MYKILIVEDESKLREFISLYFRAEGYEVVEAHDGLMALEIFKEGAFDLLVVDIMMPKLDGYGLCQAIRRVSQVPIIILTAITTEESALKCYDLGADDYICKPLKGKTLVAKSKRMLARLQAEDHFVYKDLCLDFKSHILTLKGVVVDLAPKEYTLLQHLVQNKNIALARNRLLEAVWGYSFYGETRVVDNHIKKLRKKLGDYAPMIQTVSKVGYRFQAPEVL